MASGEYSKIRQIGKGSFGSAYLVQRTGEVAPEQQLVLKEVDLSNRDALQRAAAEVEVKVLSSLKHPYIVKYHESFVRDSVLSIVMDFCEAGDLNRHVSRQRRNREDVCQAQVLRWFTQLCLALRYLHERKCLHRDIKSQNIFLTRCDGSELLDLRIADFGVAKVLNERCFAKTQIGTPYYLSPEICKAQPYSCPSDVWALGCVLYEMCTLRLPFDGANIDELVDKILRGPLPRLPSNFPADLVDIGADILQRNASRRPSANALLQRPVLKAEMDKLAWTLEGQSCQKDQPDAPRDEPPRGSVRDLLCGGRLPARPLSGSRLVRAASKSSQGEARKSLAPSWKGKAPEPLQDELLEILLRDPPLSTASARAPSASPLGRPISRKSTTTAQEIVRPSRAPSCLIVGRQRSKSSTSGRQRSKSSTSVGTVSFQ